MGMVLTRRAFVGGAIAMGSAPAWSREPDRDISFAQDFDEMWGTLASRYCFFGEKRTDWRKVRQIYRPRAIAAPSVDDFATVLNAALAELYDAHTSLRNGPNGIPRVPPFDLIVARDPDGLRVTAVQPDSAATAAGIAIGDVVTGIEGRAVADAVRDAALLCLAGSDPEADRFVINRVIAGRRATPRRLTTRRLGTVDLPLRMRDPLPDISHRRLPDGVGYVAIRSFGEEATIVAFDAALDDLRDAPALIIDVRGNGGGDTAVARPIMGRFITAEKPYAFMRRRSGAGLGPRWTESVEPRGPFTYAAPVVVLCDRWSASMAEGFPMGMRGLGRARIVGTPMMGLGAAVFPLRLDRTGLDLQYSAEPVYDVRDQPRWHLRPDVELADGADILAAGIAEARRLIAG
ncbi:S41 family peptidase [Sphingomonas sp.]|uniref:S41 family peptidase n=1 Tax=Sphingomonas sp. TaxID=28214 RepID=UPI001ED3A09A|nr:S41 family peptidase [Sphingomonas sp.]MBX3593085.1 peptidase S41 [Sphingomonas sp.]